MRSVKFIALLLLVSILGVFSAHNNPNTAMSGAGNYYAVFGDDTLGVHYSDPAVYDAIGEDFTIEMWFRKTCGRGEYRPMLSKHPQDPFAIRNVPNGQTEYLLEVQYNDSINFFTGCGGFANYGYYVAVDQERFYPKRRPYTVIRNRWTHVAVSVNWKEDEIGIPTGVATLYIDGIIVDSALWASESPSCFGKTRQRAIGEPVRLGFFDNQDPGVQTWCGDLDEIRIWSVARSPQEIKSFYQGGIPPTSKGIVSYHTFSEGPGSLFSVNQVSKTGFPHILFNPPFPQNWEFFQRSNLKVAPNPKVACKGYTVTAQFFGTDPTNGDYDFYITEIIRNTDAVFLWSDRRNPVPSNIRRVITDDDLPLNVGRHNLIEYVAGDVAGVDLVYYEARNNFSFPEPSGPATLTFITRCCGDQKPDQCRVCGGDGTNCSVSCDGHGGVKDECGVCNGEGRSCKGCDGRPFSPVKFDACGVCGGDGRSCRDPCNGDIDDCGVCNGKNECCLEYKGISKKRLDWVLLNYTLGIASAKLSTIDRLLQQSHDFIEGHNNRYRLNEFSPTGVVLPSRLPFELASKIHSINEFAETTAGLNAVLDAFINRLAPQIREPYPEVKFPHVIF